jgi:hypothetical protein
MKPKQENFYDIAGEKPFKPGFTTLSDLVCHDFEAFHFVRRQTRRTENEHFMSQETGTCRVTWWALNGDEIVVFQIMQYGYWTQVTPEAFYKRYKEVRSMLFKAFTTLNGEAK